MYVDLTLGRAAVRQADDLKSLSVKAPGGHADAAVLGGLGEPSADGAHVWLDVPALREAAAATIDPAGRADWLVGFDGMIAYATSKGWTDDQGRVRAHVEAAP